MADDASITPTIYEHPQVEIARLRRKCERAVDKLLLILDALGADADEEPSLGFSEVASFYYAAGVDQTNIAEGATDDREGEHDGREPPEDPEETLGRSENIDQRRVEYGQDDREPSLGSLGQLDQRQWAAGDPHADLDVEEQCEDEGAWDDREPDDWGWEAPDGGTAYPSAAGSWPPERVL